MNLIDKRLFIKELNSLIKRKNKDAKEKEHTAFAIDAKYIDGFRAAIAEVRGIVEGMPTVSNEPVIPKWIKKEIER